MQHPWILADPWPTLQNQKDLGNTRSIDVWLKCRMFQITNSKNMLISYNIKWRYVNMLHLRPANDFHQSPTSVNLTAPHLFLFHETLIRKLWTCGGHTHAQPLSLTSKSSLTRDLRHCQIIPWLHNRVSQPWPWATKYWHHTQSSYARAPDREISFLVPIEKICKVLQRQATGCIEKLKSWRKIAAWMIW